MNLFLGIDFGTSNTHVAYCDSNDRGKLNPIPIKLGGKASTTTCVLWRRPAVADEEVVAFGTVALEEWSQFDAGERAAYRFAFGFKPDIVRSEQARRDAIAFLRKVCGEVREVFPRLVADGTVVIGVPAEVGPEHTRQTLAAAQVAGFANVECIAEPLGALAYHLNNSTVSYAEARQGVIVIDFGGGTLDVALVDPSGLREPWGDPLLGGRLFDDLFFQWVQSQNAPFQIDEREALVVWQKECRELKEGFSRHWKVLGDGMDNFKYAILVGDTKKWLKNASVAEFEQRARNYRPSTLVLDYFRQFGVPTVLESATPIDLYAWIRRTLTGNESGRSLTGKYRTVILTGGSSEWPFMRKLAAEVFGVDSEANIRKSEDPETTIGSGLALYTVLKARLQTRRETIRTDQGQYRDRFVQGVEQRLDKFANDAAAAVVAALMPQIDAVFWNWYDHGGSLAAVETQVEALCREFAGQAAQVLEPHWRALDADLVRRLRIELTRLFQEHAVAKDVSSYLPESFTLGDVLAGAGQAGDQIAGELVDLARLTAFLATAIITAIVALIVKVKLIVLAFVAPLIGLLLTFGSLLAAIGLRKKAGSYAEDYVKQLEFGPKALTLLHVALPRGSFAKRLQHGHDATQTQIADEIRNRLRGSVDINGTPVNFVETAARAFTAIVTQVIADLGVLEQISPESDAVP